MAENEITLSELIDQVKEDLFSMYRGTEREGKIAYPIFFIDGVELEIAVNIGYEAGGGIKVSIPQIAEGSVTTGHETSTAHKMKISLSPILTREELRMLIDDRTMQGVKETSGGILRRGDDDLAGEVE